MHKALIAALALGWVAGATAVAEDGGTSMVDMLQRSNSGLRRFVLENGMVVLLKEDHSAPVVAIQVWVGAGSIYEDEHLGCGLSHFVEHMIFKGTPTRSPGDISRQNSDVGGDINAYTAHDRTVFYVK